MSKRQGPFAISCHNDDYEKFIEILTGLLTPFPEVHDEVVASERQQIIDEMVTPLTKYLTDQVREYSFFNGDTFVYPFRVAVDKLLSAVEAKLKEIQG